MVDVSWVENARLSFSCDAEVLGRGCGEVVIRQCRINILTP